MEQRLNQLIDWLNEAPGFYLHRGIQVYDSLNSGRGVHVRPDTVVKSNETLIQVPLSHQLNYITILKCFKTQDNLRKEIWNGIDVKSLTSFQLILAYILVERILVPSIGGTPSFWEPFFQVWPQRCELEAIPALWKDDIKYVELSQLLSPSLQQNTIRIQHLLEADWLVVLHILHKVTDNCDKLKATQLPEQVLRNEFVLHYFIINSRCLYMDIPAKRQIGDKASCFTLVPYVDFLNHSAESRTSPLISMPTRDFKIISGEELKNEAEIYLSYGAHSNEFLLSEYGFVLEKNRWNYVDITSELTLLLENEQEFLESRGFWGEYTIDPDGPSYRTLVAAASHISGDFRLVDHFIAGLTTENSFDLSFLEQLIRELEEQYRSRIQKLEYCRQSRPRDSLIALYKSYSQVLHSSLVNAGP